MKRSSFALVFSCQVILSVVLIALGFAYLPSIMMDVIRHELVLKEGSTFFQYWSKPPLNPEMRVHLFNYINVERWINGTDELLHIEQVGPFVYKEEWQKSNVTFQDEERLVSYDLLKVFQFQDDRSHDSSTTISIPNVPFLSASAILKNSGMLSLMGFQSALGTLEHVPEVFVSHSAHDILWGYDDPLVDLASVFLPDEIRVPGQFGLFAGKNGTSDGRISVQNGKRNYKQVGLVKKWKGSDHFSAWNNDKCNQVSGFEGMMFPGPIMPSDQLELFVPDLCRSLPLVFQEHVEHYEIQTMRFGPHSDVFDYAKDMNKCYCDPRYSETQDKKQRFNDFGSMGQFDLLTINVPCAGRGLFDVSPCKFGAPLVVSWPHFLGTDPQLVPKIKGLRPIKALHTFSMDFHPDLGLGLHAKIRLQINIRIHSNLKLEQFKNVPASFDGMVLPIMWFEDTVDNLPDELVNLLHTSMSLGSQMSFGLAWILLLTLSLELGLFYAYPWWKTRSKVQGSVET